ncbi:hypothetical protein Ccrd_000256 [Cynara cardunculus var. scolymus]|uniref:Uncharacterized protein n=1 Tax=Cynara cardunculus var. scolymus TaxID=59895 RepID=A0A103XVE8_CYNCS|nr:hypothetical protein Ccrd_000256 [Cynara cardunculus var. scolymus]
MEKNPFFLFFVFIIISCTSALTSHQNDQVTSILGEDNLGHWRNGILSSSAEAPGPAGEPSGALVLAGSRTKRPDILNRFKRTGCILLSVGQDEFHREAVDTLNYVVNQSDYTVQTLVNVTGYLSLAKTVNVAQFYLPSDVKDSIDKLNIDLNAASDKLGRKTHQNSQKIRTVFDAAIIDDYRCNSDASHLSILGQRNAIHIFIIGGWLLVVVTFILCGVFVILNNAISDTCLAMEQWVDHPHAETALSNILPCVDQGTTNQTLYKSKQVINDLGNIVNGFIGSYANSYPQPSGNTNYFNQSGPLMPYVCSPYDSQLQERECSSQEISMSNASLVWQNYTCTVSESGLCITTGRLTPEMYQQLVGAVNISYALHHYTPPLLSFQDCNFVRETFTTITSDHCLPLQHHLRLVNAGLALVSAGVMLSLALWIIFANRPQREEVFAKITSTIKYKCNGKLCRGDNTIRET